MGRYMKCTVIGVCMRKSRCVCVCDMSMLHRLGICTPIFTVQYRPLDPMPLCTHASWPSLVCIDRGFNMGKSVALCKCYGWMFV